MTMAAMLAMPRWIFILGVVSHWNQGLVMKPIF
jgi:hypothetical protein